MRNAVTVSLDDDRLRKLDKLAKDTEKTRSGVVRELIDLATQNSRTPKPRPPFPPGRV